MELGHLARSGFSLTPAQHVSQCGCCTEHFSSAGGGWWLDVPAKHIESMVIEGNANGTVLVLVEGGVPSDYL